MPWKETNIMNERINFVINASLGHSNISQLCQDYGISRQTGYRWLNRYKRTSSVSSLADHSSRPHYSPSRTPTEIENQVVSLRRRYGWGARKLHQLLLDQGMAVAVSTIHNVLKRNDLLLPKMRHRPALKRFQRSDPNQLWQMDFKGDYAADGGRCHPLTLLDDHSRYSLAICPLPGQTTRLVRDSLVNVFEEYGLPEAMLMDHGSPWWSTTTVHGLTRLSVWLIKHDIKLIYGAVAHPQTQGKIERFHRTLAENIRFHGFPKSMADWRSYFMAFRDEYNHIRPHEALQMAVPASSYTPSKRCYHDQVGQWLYPEGAIVKRLNSQGCLKYRQTRYFVCGALASERVQLEYLEDKLLVSYRNQYIREIVLKTRKTRAIKDK